MKGVVIMRFGCCGNLASTQPGGVGLEIVKPAAEFGYDYVELPLAEMSALSDEDFASLRKTVAESGIHCEVCNNLFPASVRLTGADADFGKVEAYLDKALARAESLGVKAVVFGSGGAKTVPAGFPYDEAYKQVVSVSRIVSREARKHGIMVAIEPIRKPECNIINSFAEGVKLADDVNEDNVRVLVDFFHLTWEKEDPEVLVKYGKDYLIHVHFAFPQGGDRIYPESLSEYPYQPFIDAIKACGYSKRISLEAGCKPDFNTQAPRALRFLHEVF